VGWPKGQTPARKEAAKKNAKDERGPQKVGGKSVGAKREKVRLHDRSKQLRTAGGDQRTHRWKDVTSKKRPLQAAKRRNIINKTREGSNISSSSGENTKSLGKPPRWENSKKGTHWGAQQEATAEEKHVLKEPGNSENPSN